MPDAVALGKRYIVEAELAGVSPFRFAVALRTCAAVTWSLGLLSVLRLAGHLGATKAVPHLRVSGCPRPQQKYAHRGYS
jgi:hypothetical protein